MKVRILNADEGGCGHYRCIFPAEALKDSGHDVQLMSTGFVPADTDVLVIQRPLSRHIPEQVIPNARQYGIAIVVEIDDDFTALPASNPAFHNTHPRRNPDANWNWLGAACRAADLVTCTTAGLASRYAPGKAAVIPNYVPERYLDVPHAGDGRTVGWTGVTAFHAGDLEVVGRGAANALQAGRYRFLACGDAAAGAALGVAAETAEYVPLPEYPAQVARLDVGIVPLTDNKFNEAKSALKMTEYAALGVYPVVSPSADNLRLHRETGIGSIARKPRDWQRLIRHWLDNDTERAAVTQQYRDLVRQTLTYEVNAWRWLDAWGTAQEKAKRAR